MVDVLLPGDLDDVGPGPVSGSYIPVALGDDSRDDEVPVLLDIFLFAAFVSALNIQRDPQL